MEGCKRPPKMPSKTWVSRAEIVAHAPARSPMRKTAQPDYDHGGNRNWPAFKCPVYKPTVKRAMAYDEPPQK